ncbi:MAG: hypothetical protein Ct9H90mP14_1560 [Methanobacteriota archaeon]|nr:MAG: hypothetical protein Ct9H90mP14_1560 [Euryarchaeota archaeon]
MIQGVGFLIPFGVEVIGVFAGFLGVIAWVPQIQRVWSEKKPMMGFRYQPLL